MTNLGYALDNFCHRMPAKEGDEVALFEDEFSAMFFKIYPGKNSEGTNPFEGVLPIGTATLIDSRGLFITAAHNLEGQSHWGESGSESWPNTLKDGKTSVGNYHGELYLHNPTTGTIVAVEEAGSHRTTYEDPDISLLQKVKKGEELSPAERYRPENVVNLFIGHIGNIDPTQSKVVVFGFPAEKKEELTKAMQSRPAHTLSSFAKRPDEIVFADYTVPNGFSGALAIEPHGFGIAIVKGANPAKNTGEPEQRDEKRTFFTLTNEKRAREMIAQAAKALGLSELTRKAVNEMRSNGLSEGTRDSLFKSKKILKQLDLFLLLIEMSSDLETFKPKTERDLNDWNRLIDCHNLRRADKRISVFISNW